MEGIVWLFLALVIALVALSVALAGVRRRQLSVEDNPGPCSNCATPMSLRRVVFSIWPGCSGVVPSPGTGESEAVTPTRLPDFEQSRSSIRCHFLRQTAHDAVAKGVAGMVTQGTFYGDSSAVGCPVG